jgi:glycosyltransferase involved in cell wall biosynthesis
VSDPLITCCVAAFNSERFIAEAIESILAQTYRPIEVIVVDDGSSDRTSAIAASYEPHVTIVSQTEAGPPATRNAAIRLARGELLAFLDADDLWTPEKLHRQATRLASEPDLGYCLTGARVFWSRTLAEEAARLAGHPRAQAVPGFGASSLLARRSVFDAVGLFNEDMTFGDALEWFLRADRRGVRRAILPEVLLLRRLHEGNLTRRRRAEGRARLVEFVKHELDLRRSSRHSRVAGG